MVDTAWENMEINTCDQDSLNKVISAEDAQSLVHAIISYLKSHPPVLDNHIDVLYQIIDHIGVAVNATEPFASNDLKYCGGYDELKDHSGCETACIVVVSDKEKQQSENKDHNEQSGCESNFLVGSDEKKEECENDYLKDKSECESVSHDISDGSNVKLVAENKYLIFDNGQWVEYIQSNEICICDSFTVDEHNELPSGIGEEIIANDTSTDRTTSNDITPNFLSNDDNLEINNGKSTIHIGSPKSDNDNVEITNYSGDIPEEIVSENDIFIETELLKCEEKYNVSSFDHSNEITIDPSRSKKDESNHLKSMKDQGLCDTRRKSERVIINPKKSLHILYIHKCSMCNRRFKTLVELKQHESWHIDKSKKNNQCDTCGKTFHGAYSLNVHKRTHTGEKPLKCPDCGSCFALPSTLQSHRKLHTGKKSFLCETCGQEFSRKAVLRTHMLKHTGEMGFQCDVCDMLFNRLDVLRLHRVNHHGDGSEKTHHCTVCDKSFFVKFELTRHLDTHKPAEERTLTKRPETKAFKCTQCDKKYYHHKDLKYHVKFIHMKDKPFSCKVCGKSFCLNSYLKTHMIIHSDKKPYECDICGKKFKRKNFMSNHKLIHTGERPHACEICGKTFIQAVNLRTHIHMHHTENKKYLVCPVCEKKYAKNYLKMHMKKMHGCVLQQE